MVPEWVHRFFDWLLDKHVTKGITRLEFLQVMDKLSAQISRCSIMIRGLRGKAEQAYWMDKWEELAMLHLDMEWQLHPKNPEQGQFIGE